MDIDTSPSFIRPQHAAVSATKDYPLDARLTVRLHLLYVHQGNNRQKLSSTLFQLREFGQFLFLRLTQLFDDAGV